MSTRSLRADLDREVSDRHGQIVVGPKWVLDGPGVARWGYARVSPCKEVYLGRNLDSALSLWTKKGPKP